MQINNGIEFTSSVKNWPFRSHLSDRKMSKKHFRKRKIINYHVTWCMRGRTRHCQLNENWVTFFPYLDVRRNAIKSGSGMDQTTRKNRRIMVRVCLITVSFVAGVAKGNFTIIFEHSQTVRAEMWLGIIKELNESEGIEINWKMKGAKSVSLNDFKVFGWDFISFRILSRPTFYFPLI